MAVSTNEASPEVIYVLEIGREVRNTSPRDDIQISVLTRQGSQLPFTTIGVPDGVSASVTTYYNKRWRDSGAPPPNPVYVTHVTSDLGQTYPLSPPFGGPLVDETVLEIWQF